MRLHNVPLVLASLTLFAASLVAGCGAAVDPTTGTSTGVTGDPELAPLEAALPGDDTLAVDIPAIGSMEGDAGGFGTQQGALVGETAEFWAHTARTAWHMNVGLAHILAPIRAVTKNVEPTLVGPNKAVWMGSWPLDPQHHLLVVKKKGDHFEYILLAKLKAPANAKWRVRVVGRYTPGPAPKHGHGSVWVNLNNDLNPNTHGKVLAHWSRAGVAREITAFFFKFTTDPDQAPVTSAAHYQNEADMSGLLVHAVHGFDLQQGEPGKEALEDAALISRWNTSGAGRGDLLARGGDIAAAGLQVAAMTQCWKPMSFKSTFEALTVKAPGQEPHVVKTSGEYDSCAFPEFADPSLPETGEEPAEPSALPEEAMM